MSLLDNIKHQLLKLAAANAPIDPSVFGDELASRTKWVPLVPGGSNFRTHRLAEIDDTRLELKKSLGSFAFGGAFLMFGLPGLVLAGQALLSHNLAGGMLFLLFGGPFTGVGLWAAWPTTVVFDGTARQIGLKSGPVDFSAVHALQIVRERVSSDKGSYYSYELNLVLGGEGQRLNLCDHGNLARLREDAARVQALIGCKLWDATRYQE